MSPLTPSPDLDLPPLPVGHVALLLARVMRIRCTHTVGKHDGLSTHHARMDEERGVQDNPHDFGVRSPCCPLKDP